MDSPIFETPREAARRFSASILSKGYEPVALHEYTDIYGVALYWRIRAKHPRTGEKWIRPMYISESGFEIGEPKFGRGKKPLYRLHCLVTNSSDTVWIVEGEQKAEALEKLGLLATTSGGATSADATDWEPLRGRRVEFWPDKDDSGKKYATEVTTLLLAMNCAVSCVDVEKIGVPDKGDVIDWLATHQGADSGDILALPRVVPASEVRGAAKPEESDVEDWPDPQPMIAKVNAEPYPLDALPETIRAAVIEVQGFTKAPIAMVASSALAALSLASQSHVDVKRAEKLSGPTSLFLLTIADSGERKSTCDGIFTKAIRDYEAQQAEAAKPKRTDHLAAFHAWESKRGGIRDKIRALAKQGSSTAAREAELRALGDPPEPPRVPKLIYGDATPEALKWNLAKLWPSGGVVSAEGGIVFGSHGMNKESIMRNLATLNELWDGKPISTERRTSESFTVRGARLTMGIQVQAATLRSFFERSGGLARGTGFLARFLSSWPESTQGFRPFTDPPESWPALAAFDRRLAAILESNVTIDDDGALSPSMLSLTPETKAAWIKFHDQIEVMLRPGGELHEVQDVASKSADNAVGLAALFQVFEHGIGGTVEPEAFAGASQIAAWHLSEARRFFGELALPLELANAARLDHWLVDYCKQERSDLVGKNHIRQHGPLRDGAALDAAISVLANLDRIRRGMEGKRQIICINPALIAQRDAS